METSAKDWATEQFATLELGDRRREYRAVRMLRRAAERPAGRLSEVFDSPAELQGAYDFVEGNFASECVIRALEDATLRAADGLDFMYVVLDGTSLTLTDRAKCKDFGSIGPRETLARGLKVVDALALTPEGVPLGLLDLKFWARKPLSRTARYWRRQGSTTETRHWVETLERVGERAARAGLKPWFVIDREGDCADMLRAAAMNGASFTIRSNQNRLLRPGTSQQRLLREHMKRRPILGRHFIRVPGTDGALGSPVALDVRVSRVDLDVPNYRAHPKMREALPLHVVWLRERHPPRGRKALDWMLLTNHAVVDYAAAIAVLESYCCRWRIEDFHRTWKTGRCFVEDTQLQRRDHVVRWATMLAAVAARIERLKHLSRTQPEAPASIEFSPIEIQALRIRKAQIKKRTESLPEGIPSIALAVLWLAQMGGFQGKAHEQPGSVTIGRGLERLAPFALGLEAGLNLAGK